LYFSDIIIVLKNNTARFFRIEAVMYQSLTRILHYNVMSPGYMITNKAGNVFCLCLVSVLKQVNRDHLHLCIS
jgi:hypothetical protein